VPRDVSQDLEERFGVEDKVRGEQFGHAQFCVGGVSLLDHATNASVVASQHPRIGIGSSKRRRQEAAGRVAAEVVFVQTPQGRALEQGAVTHENEHVSRASGEALRTGNGVGCARAHCLIRERIAIAKNDPHGSRVVADHDRDPLYSRVLQRLEDVPDHWFTGHRYKRLRDRSAHSLSLSGGKNDGSGVTHCSDRVLEGA
jgi:hypothetical protein